MRLEPPSCADGLEISWKTQGMSRPVEGVLYFRPPQLEVQSICTYMVLRIIPKIECAKMNYIKFSKPVGAIIAQFLAHEFESEIQPKRCFVLHVNCP